MSRSVKTNQFYLVVAVVIAAVSAMACRMSLSKSADSLPVDDPAPVYTGIAATSAPVINPPEVDEVPLAPPDEPASPGLSESLPAELIGIWVRSGGNSVGRYVFNTDGSFEYSALLQQDLAGCTNSHVFYKVGNAVADSSYLTLYPSAYLYRYEDSCNSSNTYGENRPPEVEGYPWRIGVDSLGRENLYLTFPTGGEDSWIRER